MFQLLTKIVSYFIAHKFYVQVAALGIGGITLPELIFADHAVKILVGLATLVVLADKWIKERKKNKNENNKN
jgi:hypothetical protein